MANISQTSADASAGGKKLLSLNMFTNGQRRCALLWKVLG